MHLADLLAALAPVFEFGNTGLAIVHQQWVGQINLWGGKLCAGGHPPSQQQG